jgi:poly [ADP-ribose] polymerase 2/3/4
MSRMDNWWHPDPPGTINPAKLFRGAKSAPDTFSEAFDTPSLPIPFDRQTAPEAAPQSIPPTAPTPTRPRSAVPPLRRISSDWDPEHDIALGGKSSHEDIRKEFEELHVAKQRLAAARARTRTRHNSHRGHFRSQTEKGVRICVPVNLRAGPDARVVIDRATASIYDAYLLRADIVKNVNNFRRHQVSQTCMHLYPRDKTTNQMLFNR